MPTVAQELPRRANEFFDDEDRFEGNRLYEAIVLKAREMHVAGATVLRGPMGFGHSAAAASHELQAPSILPLVANQSGGAIMPPYTFRLNALRR
jgi:PII-like signaling protein